MPSLKALKYYLSSIPTLVKGTNFFVLPLIFIKRPLVVKTSDGLEFYVDNVMDIWSIKEILLDRQYEEFYKIKAGDIVIDVGASIGDFSIQSAKTAERVYSFELNKNRIELMKLNLELNHSKNVFLDESGAHSLKKILDDNGIKKCNFLKIDCEGCEYHLLNGADEQTLRRVEHLAMEIHLFDEHMKKNFEQLIEHLTTNNFQVTVLPNAVHDYLKFVFAKNLNA